MEQDIKILLEQLKQYKRHLENYEKDDCLTSVYYELKKYAEALEHLIKAYKELEEKLNETLNANLALVHGNANSIPVSLVEEKIEELNRKIKYEDNEKVIIWLHKQRKNLQELLEKRK